MSCTQYRIPKIRRTYQGQWMRGMRHGYGIRTSAPFGKASKYRANKTLRASMTSLRSSDNQGGGGGASNPEPTEKRDRRVDDSRGGFVLKMNSSEPTTRRRSLGSGHITKGIFNIRLKKQRSTGDLEKRGTGGSIRSTDSSASWISNESAQSAMTNMSVPSDSNASFVVEDDQLDPSVKETYMGEWKNDKRSGYGISERTDGLRYEGEWYANKKYGYGVTTFTNGEKEEGKYKNNVLITSQKKKLFLMRSAKFRERIDAAVMAAQRASKIALQKADIAITRTATARGKAEQADMAAAHAKEDSDIADGVAKQYAPDFKQPGLERLRARQNKYREQNLNMNISFDINKKNEIPNQIPNQIPNEIKPNQMQNQIPNSIQHQPHLANKLNNPMQQQQNPGYNNPMQQQQNPGYNNPMMQQQQNTGYNNPMMQQQNPGYNNPMSNIPTSNPYSNPNNPYPNPNNPYPNPNNPSSQHEFGPQIDSGHNSGGDMPLHKPRNNSLPSEDVPAANLRRMSRRVSGDRPYLGNIGQQTSIDHFDHYNRPPSRDSSVDRYSRATGKLSGSMGSRQPSVDRSARPSETPDRGQRAPSAIRGTTPQPMGGVAAGGLPTKNGSVLTGSGAKMSNNNNINPSVPAQPPPFEEIIIRKRGLGQDIIPSPNQPKRTESLFISGQQQQQHPPVQTKMVN
ncbi:unnamed protein product [Brassicogethes aeneus]|uniref:Uncharacterized protein n=1 Tax=Brassicogethes aeneus TaxID=1431903 RepID=A0A9P0FHU9_BRAAE|nr:unnamed protein product [Brassicogethes aeneus]